MIPGFIITWLTFPGVIIHELAHKLFCIWTGTMVHQVCYFRFGNPAGFVIHSRPSNIWKHLLIGIGPLIVNSGLGLLIGVIDIPIKQIEIVHVIVIWLAISIAMHSFPSTGDALSMWKALSESGTSIFARIIGYPLIGFIYIGAIGSIFWLDLAYGYGIVFGIPAYFGIK